MEMKTKAMMDIENRQDIQTLVDKFYSKVKDDPTLGPVFSHLDWRNHLPIMYNFWSSMILGGQSYRGNPLQKHLHIPIDQSHFNRWLFLFTKTVDDNFEGERAEDIKSRAQAIAGIFQLKLGLVTKT